MRLRSPFGHASAFFYFGVAAALMSASAAAHMPASPTGVGRIYDARFETLTTGTAVPVDTTGKFSDRPSSKDSNLIATVEDSKSIPAGTRALNTTKFARLKESCGEAPNLAFDRGVALGTAASPNALAHVAFDVLFETLESYAISFRNGTGSGIPGPASQTIADIDTTSTGNMTFTSLGFSTTIAYQAGVAYHIDAFFDLGNNKWYAFVNGTRVVDGAAILDVATVNEQQVPVALGFVGIGFNFSSFCPPLPSASFTGVLQFDNFVFQQVAGIPGVTPPDPEATPALFDIVEGIGRPYSVAVHGGSLYVAASEAHTVWKVDLFSKEKTALAGIGWKAELDDQDKQGYNGDGIEASEAQLANPSGVAVDMSGNVYIADKLNHAIRKIGPESTFITTFAGIPTSSAVGESARLYEPSAVAVDLDGHVYVADMMNQQVKKVDKTTGAISVVVGVAGRPGNKDGSVAGAEFCLPADELCTLAARLNSAMGVAVDVEGIVYIAEDGNNAIRKVTLGGNVSTLRLSEFTLKKPTGVAVSGGAVYIADYGNHRVLRADCDGEDCNVTTIAGSGLPGSLATPGSPASDVELNSPTAVAIDGNFLYIADKFNQRILVIDLNATNP